MDSFHYHLDELERLLGDDDKEKGQMKSRALSFAAFVGSNPVVETLIQKGVGKKYRHPIRVLARPLADGFASFGSLQHRLDVVDFSNSTIWITS